MFLQAASRLGVVGRQVLHHARRNIGVTAVASQKAATVTDPIQQMFLDKIREYKTKSVGGKLVDASPEVESALQDELLKLERVYDAKGKDMTQFPTFSFTDPTLESVGLGDAKNEELDKAMKEAQAAAEAQAREAEEEEE